MLQKTQNPLVSVIVRTKDRPKLLVNAIKSIQQQTYRPIEVVLVNDGGCDLDTEEIKSILGDVTLSYIRLEKNTGRAHAGNVGIENAKGEYIGFLDDDDEFYPEHLETLISAIEESKGYSCAYTDAELVDRIPKTQKLNLQNADISKEIFESCDFNAHILLFENYIPLICILLKRHEIIKLRGFDTSLTIFEDWDLLIRLSLSSIFLHIPKVTAKYIIWSETEQIAFNDFPGKVECYIKIINKHFNSYKPAYIYEYLSFKENQLLKKIRKYQIEFLQKGDTLYQLIESVDNLKETIDTLVSEKKTLLESNADLNTQNYRLQQKLQEQTIILNEINKQLTKQIDYINEIHNSFGWRCLRYFRNKIKPLFIPSGSKRDTLYRLTLKTIVNLKDHGLKKTTQKIKSKIRQKTTKRRINKELFTLPKIQKHEIKLIDTKLSVIIPTKNAGDEFSFVLQKIIGQVGIKESEIIIVDSGSKDDTIRIAKKFGSKVFSIPPENFNHGSTRNFGAEKASGEYLLFMSQDVIPIGFDCFYNIVSLMKNNQKVAAATVKQIPRSDADIFACWQLWYYYNFLLKLEDDFIVSIDPPSIFTTLNPEDKRRFCQIDNTLSCIRKDVFDKYKFKEIIYAEDLDLGLRLISGGYNIAFFASIGSIHSHTREASYYFKRSFVDALTVTELLKIEAIQWGYYNIHNLQGLLNTLYAFYKTLNYAINQNNLNNPINEIVQKLRDLLLDCHDEVNLDGDLSIDKIFNSIGSIPQESHEINASALNLIRNHYFSILDSLRDYLNNTYKTTESLHKDLTTCFYKLFAVTSGSLIGNFTLYAKHNDLKDPLQEKIYTLLSEAI